MTLVKANCDPVNKCINSLHCIKISPPACVRTLVDASYRVKSKCKESSTSLLNVLTTLRTALLREAQPLVVLALEA